MPDGLTIVMDGKQIPAAPAPNGETTERLLIGQISGAHGVRGMVRVKSFTANPADLDAYGILLDQNGRSLPLSIVGRVKDQFLAKIDGVADRDAADRWRGVKLYVPRAALPDLGDEDDFYHADLIGLDVVDRFNTSLGVVTAIHDFGAGDVLELAVANGQSRYLPFTRQVVPTVDLAGGRLIADPPEEVGEPEPVAQSSLAETEGSTGDDGDRRGGQA